MTHIIPANPGFWVHWVTRECTQYTNPIIAWRLDDKGDVEPIILDAVQAKASRWDTATEYPDGSCVDDSGEWHPTVDDWRAATKASWEEAQREDRIAAGRSSR
jgi:hypothetical protein